MCLRYTFMSYQPADVHATRVLTGRWRGGACPAKLSREIAVEIRRWYDLHPLVTLVQAANDMGQQYGVSPQTIRDVLRNVSWREANWAPIPRLQMAPLRIVKSALVEPDVVPCPANTPALAENAEQQLQAIEAHLGRPLSFRAAVTAAMLVLCLLPALAFAQPAINPTSVEFDPSPDHATLTSYLLSIYVAGQSASTASLSLGKPAPEQDGKIRSEFVSKLATPLKAGVTYEARVSAVGLGGTTPSQTSNQFTITSTCPVSVSVATYAVQPLGGSGSVTVKSATGCTWTAVSSASWLTVTAGASGTGDATLVFAATANQNLTQPRTATLTVGDQTVTVTQGVVACTFDVVPSSMPLQTPVAVTGELFEWPALSGDRRALRRAAGTDRVAAAWFSNSSLVIDATVVPGMTQQIAVYLADYDNSGRQERVEVLSDTGAVLDSRTATDFTAGQYLTWTVRGKVTIRVTRVSGTNAVVSGVFMGPILPTTATGSAATFISTDTTTGGDWPGVYGIGGYAIARDETTRWLSAFGGIGQLTVTTPPVACPWTASSDAAWLSITSPNGSGTGVVAFTVAANPVQAQRTGTLTVGGQILKVTQAAAVGANQPIDCVVSAWSPWSVWSAWTQISATTEQHTQTRTRSVVIPAANGGAACPALLETATETRAITTGCPASELPSVFVTRYVMSGNGRPGSLMYVLYQASSAATPVKQVKVKIDGAVVASSPDTNADVAAFGSMWFPTPASGSHKLSVEATNTCGSREAASPLSLRVK